MPDNGLNLWIEDLRHNEVGLRLRVRSVLHAEYSPFQRLAIFDSLAFGKVFVQGDEIVLTEFDAQTWNECLVHPAACAQQTLRNCLVIGGGDGGVASELCRYPNIESITVVEIDQRVVDLSREYFPSMTTGLDDPRVTLVIDDAHRWLGSNEQRYDLIVVDAAQLHDPAAEVVHDAGLTAVLAGHLAAGGALVAPLGNPQHDGERCRLALGELRSQLAAVRPYLVGVPSLPGGSVAIAWAAQQGDPSAVPELQEWMAKLEHWEPVLNQRLFTLPKPVARVLG